MNFLDYEETFKIERFLILALLTNENDPKIFNDILPNLNVQEKFSRKIECHIEKNKLYQKIYNNYTLKQIILEKIPGISPEVFNLLIEREVNLISNVFFFIIKI